jgi:tRNA pseudouridine38-40 synthase
VRTWRLTLEYDGTKYRGWQEQRNARTIQGELRKAFEEYFGRPVDLQGAGRTDAGVHAIAQVAHVRADVKERRPVETMLRVINDRLPSEIVVTGAVETANRFHARHDALSRSYVYQISTRKTAFSKRYVWWIKDRLDVDAMSRAAKMVAGRHNFACFRTPDPSKPDESTIVVVEAAELDTDGDLVLFRIEASHFLWRMVRRIVGVLVKVGLGQVTIEQFGGLLDARCRRDLDVAAWTAPASGLFLESVRYADDAVRGRSADRGTRRSSDLSGVLRHGRTRGNLRGYEAPRKPEHLAIQLGFAPCAYRGVGLKCTRPA